MWSGISTIGDVSNTSDVYMGCVGGTTKFGNGSIAEVMVLVGAQLDILTDEFALFAYNQALGYPLSLPHEPPN